MSTVYDALKKAEAERKRAEGLDFKSTDNTDPKTNVGTPKNITAIILSVAVIVVFVIAFYRIKGSFESPNKPMPVNTNTQLAVKTVAPMIKPQRTPGTYGLDGVIDSGENSMAVINGKLMKPEDSIDSLVLKSVSPREVKLLNTKDNSTVILRIQ